jgi:group I intron endonuclease
MESAYCIYIHKNKINNKIYVGQTSQKPEKRWKLGEGYKTSTKFYNAIKKYGWDNFEHIILKDNLTLEEANYWEEYYIKQYDSYRNGYNATMGGKNIQKTEEHKQKIRQSNIGKHNHNGKLNPMYGKTLSEETKNKIREKQKYFKVRCVETGEIFNSCHLAAAWCGLKRDGNIPDVCRGKRKVAGGYHWEFVKEEK